MAESSSHDRSRQRSSAPHHHAPNGHLESSKLDHTYHDYSTLDDNTITILRGESTGASVRKPTKKSRFVSFPMKLHKILSDPKNHDIIRWGPHGRTWNIYDKKRLEDVCREHFKHGSFNSFNRSVNGWGFKVCDACMLFVDGILFFVQCETRYPMV